MTVNPEHVEAHALALTLVQSASQTSLSPPQVCLALGGAFIAYMRATGLDRAAMDKLYVAARDMFK
jgi:hypothetical protein